MIFFVNFLSLDEANAELQKKVNVLEDKHRKWPGEHHIHGDSYDNNHDHSDSVMAIVIVIACNGVDDDMQVFVLTIALVMCVVDNHGGGWW